MPVTIFEGIRDEQREDLRRKNLERRFYELATAVRKHESAARRDGAETPHDETLYRELRRLGGEPVTLEQPSA